MNYKILVVSNVPVQSFIDRKVQSLFGDKVEITYLLSEELCASYHILNKMQMIFLVFSFSVLCGIYEYNHSDDAVQIAISKMNEMISGVTRNASGKVYCFSFSDCIIDEGLIEGHAYPSIINRVNYLLYAEWKEKVFFIDMDSLRRISIEVPFVDFKNLYRWNQPISQAGLLCVADEMYKQYCLSKGISKKCIVMDCDNVLWGGEVAENGIEGIRLSSFGEGLIYKRFQLFVRSLFYHGIILAICSKNNESDVLNIFEVHDEMVLKKDNISCFMVNWDSKVANISRIAEYLNISLDSIVFVDDQLYEIEQMKGIYPEVTSIRFSAKMDYGIFFSMFNQTVKSIEEVNERTQTYQLNEARIKERFLYDTESDYLASLKIQVDIHPMKIFEFDRVAVLSQRMNKCTTGKRFELDELHKKAMDADFFTVHLSDKYSKYGLVGIIEIQDDNLVLFGLSCRALGKNVEKDMISFVKQNYSIRTITCWDTGKNSILLSMLERELCSKLVYQKE